MLLSLQQPLDFAEKIIWLNTDQYTDMNVLSNLTDEDSFGDGLSGENSLYLRTCYNRSNIYQPGALTQVYKCSTITYLFTTVSPVSNIRVFSKHYTL